MAQNKTLTISWWGFNGDKLEEIILKPFRAQCGCELVFETGNNADRLNKIKIRGGRRRRRRLSHRQLFPDRHRTRASSSPSTAPRSRTSTASTSSPRAPQGKFGPAYTIGRVGIIYDSAKVSTPDHLLERPVARGVQAPRVASRHHHHGRPDDGSRRRRTRRASIPTPTRRPPSRRSRSSSPTWSRTTTPARSS